MDFDLIAAALAEDIGSGDITCRYFTDSQQQAEALIMAKQEAVLAGIDVAVAVFKQVDSELEIEVLSRDGRSVGIGESVLRIKGSVASILTAERVALNFVQRLSGVATLTRRYVDAIRGTNAKILDTRKTTPGFRMLEKSAVVAGGGENHRLGLYDRVMVKDNHLAAKEDIAFLQNAIRNVRAEHPGVLVELEADTLGQVERFLGMEGVDIILLDNMSCEEMTQAVRLGAGRVKFEASGGVNLQTVRGIAETGVDFISVGALTHSAPAVDFSLELKRC